MLEISQQIKAAREQKGVVLEEIAKSTRIGLNYLRDIEQGKFDFLPRPYVLAFTKTFANYLGLDGESLAQQLKAALTPVVSDEVPAAHAASTASAMTMRHEPRVQPEASESDSIAPSLPYLREILIGAGIVLLVIISLIVVSRSSEESIEEAPADATRSAKNVQEMSFEEMAKQVAAIADSQTRAERIEPELLKLEAQVEAPVWMRVAVDSAEAVANTFQRGSIAWQAKEKFTLRVGNAGSVIFVLDGKILGRVGESGQRIEVMITREGFKDKRILPPSRPRVRADSSGT